MSGINSLETLRRRAIHIKREQGLKHHQALNVAAIERGYQNYAQAVRLFDGAAPKPILYPVTLNQFWSNRQVGQRGVETLVVMLQQPLTELIKQRHLVGYLGGTQISGDGNLALPHEIHMDDRAEYAMQRLHRAARALEFIEITGLYPSTALRCYPKGEWENRPPIADHDHCWYDPETRQYLLTTEPYPDRRKERLDGWRHEHGYDLSQVPWGSIYGYGTELWFAAKTRAFDMERLSARLSAKPSSYSDDK
ncbi:hypothetical protein [Asticcacaulis sp.]|uniref:hypothetical protein n=1 Tax=Asticcacaulis sp. TaxID=1872648 RepID=UPI002B764007|nr:hypothetical protein [Asticcacaulis sp.]HTM81909.1 hypothetical protein [Asticcacaulis sp.]